MTKDEIGDLIEALPQGLDTDEFIYRLVNWAVDKEREACAKLVEADGLARGDEGRVLIKAAGRIRAGGEKLPVKSYCGGKPNYCTHVDAVPGFSATEPRQSLSRMKPGDRFVLVRTSEIYHIKKDGHPALGLHHSEPDRLHRRIGDQVHQSLAR